MITNKYYLTIIDVISISNRIVIAARLMTGKPDVGNVIYLDDELNSFEISGVGFMPVGKWQDGVHGLIIRRIKGEKIPQKGDKLYWFSKNQNTSP